MALLLWHIMNFNNSHMWDCVITITYQGILPCTTSLSFVPMNGAGLTYGLYCDGNHGIE